MLTPEEKRLREAAEAADQAGDLAAEYAAWQALSFINPKRPDYPCQLGRAAVKLKRWAEAEQAFLEAIRIDETLWLAMALLGASLLRRTDGDESSNALRAKEWLERAVAIAPNPLTLSMLASAHVQLGEVVAAKRLYRQVIEIEESYDEAYFNLGVLLTDEGNTAEAEAFLRKAAQLDPDSSHAHGALGIVLKQLGKYAEAESELKRAIKLNPADTIARRHLPRTRPSRPAQVN
jgi:Flp pilus assembly protein TadD